MSLANDIYSGNIFDSSKKGIGPTIPSTEESVRMERSVPRRNEALIFPIGPNRDRRRRQLNGGKKKSRGQNCTCKVLQVTLLCFAATQPGLSASL